MGKLLGDYTEARTLFAFMFYFTFCYLVLKKIDVPPELNTIVSSLMGYWFGQKNAPKTQADIDNQPTTKVEVSNAQDITVSNSAKPAS